MNEKERLEKVMESESVTPTQFADTIGIQRSTLSHILNGRNAPSLDVLQRILNAYRAISSDWLILGTGSMYRTVGSAQQATLFDVKPELPVVEPLPSQVEAEHPNDRSTVQNPTPNVETLAQSVKIESESKTVRKIVVFYSDSTYEEFKK